MRSNHPYYHIHIRPLRSRFYCPVFIGLLLFLFICPSTVKGQQSLAHAGTYSAHYFFSDTAYMADSDTTDRFSEEDSPPFDIVLLTLNVVRIGSFEIEALIFDEMAYLPVHQLFDFLKIRNSLSDNIDSVSGFFGDPKAIYLIDKSKNRIFFQDKLFRVKATDLLRTETDLYLKADYFGKVFGLECLFNFRSLSISLNAKAELPIIREMQQEAMRQNINKFKGEKKADTTISRKNSLFQLGVADWSVNTSQQGGGKSSVRTNLDLGALIAGGEASAYMNYNTDQTFDITKQYFRWRYVNNNNPVLRQVTAGRIGPSSIASLFAPVMGIQFTNTPTTYRKSFGTYTISDKTEPGWTVELYMNDVLIDYTKADASGFFTFEVPMIYGSSVVKLRYYGPWGEEKSTQQNIYIPFNFVPLHQLEYSVSAGVVTDDQKNKFARGNLSYGLTRRVTIGTGVEYLSSVASGKAMPFLNTSIRLGSNLLLSGEHAFGVRSKVAVNYRQRSNVRIDIDYIKYEKGQTAIFTNYLEEKRAVISMPVRGRKYNALSRLTLNQFSLPGLPSSAKATRQYTTAEFLISGAIGRLSANLTTNMVINRPAQTWTYSNLSLTLRLPKGISVTPQTQYDFLRRNIGLIKAEVQKPISFKGFLNVFYEKNITFKTTSMGLGFRYNFSFAQTSFLTRKTNNTITVSQSARGSLVYNDKTNDLHSSNQSSVGRGSLIVVPFLDLNCNNKRDKGEPKAFGLKLSVNGGRITHHKKDSTISIEGLEAYNNYYLELDKNSFENIAWQIRKKTIKVMVEPNHFKLIEVPVAVVGEVSGTVSLRNKDGVKGLSRIIVNIYDKNSVLVAKTLTENDGYFSYMGLAPGTYTARIEPAQLAKIKMHTSSDSLTFNIRQSLEGDIADGLEFTLEEF